MLKGFLIGVMSFTSASAALADDRLILMVVGSDPATSVYCDVAVLPAGGMTTLKQILGNSFPARDQPLEVTDERTAQFAALVEALKSGEFPQSEAVEGAVLPGDPTDTKLVPPYVLVAYSQMTGGEVTRGYRAVLPGKEVPPLALALFGPLHDGECTGN